jgi:hypothetical protein
MSGNQGVVYPATRHGKAQAIADCNDVPGLLVTDTPGMTFGMAPCAFLLDPFGLLSRAP